MTYFRRWPEDRDPAELLDPENQVSTPWGSADHGPCDKCGGSGESDYECLSCLEGGADDDCPACGGRVRFRDRCPTCEGDGEIDHTEREGVSVFPSRAGLLRYLVEREVDLDGAVILEFEGESTSELDLDADAGAMLVRPTRIVATHSIDGGEVEEVRRRVG